VPMVIIPIGEQFKFVFLFRVLICGILFRPSFPVAMQFTQGKVLEEETRENYYQNVDDV